MNTRRRHDADAGIVSTSNLKTAYTREIFFPVDPMTLDYLDYDEVKELFPTGHHLEFDPLPLLVYIPELEAEIFWLLYVRDKNQ